MHRFINSGCARARPLLSANESDQILRISQYIHGVIRIHYPPSAVNASWKSGTSSALPLGRLHFTMPCPSTAKLPALCHLDPLSVGLFHTPSSLPNLTTSYMLQGLSTCQKEDTPKPHAAYMFRSSSTIMSTKVFRSGSGSDWSQRPVEGESLCETATKWMSGYWEATERRLR